MAPIVFTALTSRPRSRPAWFGVVLASLGALVFPAYVGLVLRLPAWTPVLVQSTRGRGGLALPGANIVEAIRQIAAQEFFVADILDLAAILFFGLLAIPVWRSLPRVHGVYYVTLLGLLLVRMGTDALCWAQLARHIPFSRLHSRRWGSEFWVHRAILYNVLLASYMSAHCFGLLAEGHRQPSALPPGPVESSRRQ
jgi:hypothetical protein